MSGRCAACRWWQDDPAALDAIGGTGPVDWRRCTLELEEDARFAVASLDLSAALFTAPDFGCVQWEPEE